MVIGPHCASAIYNQTEDYYNWLKILCVTVCNEMYLLERFSASLALCEGGPVDSLDSPRNRPETQSFDVFFAVSLNKLLKKQLSYN